MFTRRTARGKELLGHRMSDRPQVSGVGRNVFCMELFLIIFVLILFWQNNRRARRAAMIMEAERQETLSRLSAFLSAPSHELQRGTIRANSDGYTYWYAGDDLVRAPLVNGDPDLDRSGAADPATCPDLTPELVAEIADALEQAADDFLHGRYLKEGD